MLIRGVIFEGLSQAGKTSTLNELRKLHAQDFESERNTIVLGEHYSQILNKINGNLVRLTREEHLNLLDERVTMLEQIYSRTLKLGSASRRSRGIFFIFERFHLNHRLGFENEDLSRIENIEERLVKLGAKTILLTVSADVLRTRIQSREPDKREKSSENENDKVCEDFISSQDRLRKCSEKSMVPTFEINTDERCWNLYAKKILTIMDW